MMLKRMISCVLLCLMVMLFSACQPAEGENLTSATNIPSSPAITTIPMQTPTEMPANTPLPAPTDRPTSTPDQLVLLIPEGKPDAIDGIISPGEWDAALVDTFSDGSEMLLMYKEGYLYVAIRANTAEAVAGNIYIFSGEEISIHHTSAALGSGRYEKDAGGWRLIQPFVWRCRDTLDSEAARSELDKFFRDEGWVSINSWMGTPNELEYIIKMPADNFSLAANYITATADAVKIPWPQDLQDDSTVIMTGGLPQQLAFTPELWAVIEIQN